MVDSDEGDSLDDMPVMDDGAGVSHGGGSGLHDHGGGVDNGGSVDSVDNGGSVDSVDHRGGVNDRSGVDHRGGVHGLKHHRG